MHITPFEASAWARRQRMGDIGAKIILMLLADYSDDAGTCFPGIDRIAEETEQSKSTVLRKLRLLTELGLVSVERRNGENGYRTSNRYVMDLTVTVSKADVAVAKERLAERNDEDGSVQGVNLTLGSEEGPKCQNEGSKVSPDDTVTTRGTTSTSPYPHDTTAGEQEPASPRLTVVPAASAPSGPEIAPQIAFSDWWEKYPRKVGKAAAERHWTRAVRRTSPAVIMAGLEAHLAEWRRKGTGPDYIPHGATWLNQRRWEDELQAETVVDPYADLPSPSEQRRSWQ